MKKEFYIIVSKDKKYFIGSSYYPCRLSPDKIFKAKGFKTKEEAEEVCRILHDSYKKDIEKDLVGIEWSREHGFTTLAWKDRLRLDQRKLKAVEDACVKKVVLTYKIS